LAIECVEAMLLSSLSVAHFKEVNEYLEESLVQELRKQILLHPYRHLVQNVLFFLLIYGRVLIFLPPVVEVPLNLETKLNI